MSAMELTGKIQNLHLDRLAIVYIRQSTIQQIERHSESTKLQYALAQRAQDLGWPKSQVLIIDEDLGLSGSSAEGRPGFQRLVAEVGLDHVGIVLGIEMSRLARSCRDWHQLLEICALFRTLIGDTDGIYDPTSYNDRLLLGLKGTLSEAELHIIKQRMLEGKRAKARRGELVTLLPMGYVWHLSGEIQKDPDEQAQSVIQLVFDLFRRFSTVYAVLRYLVKYKIQMPYRLRSGYNKGDLEWRRPNRVTLCNMLHNAIYAGAYVYGRRPTDGRKKKPGRPSTGRTVAKPAEWQVLLKGKVPAYITWEQYENNLLQLEKNRNQSMGAIRNGTLLLSGLLICGHCGLRMQPHYNPNQGTVRYTCHRMMVDYAEPACQSLTGTSLDKLILKWVFKALEPASLEISLKISDNLIAEREHLQLHWKQRLERARFQVERAHRQYNAVEPENRLVARSLERQWEEALASEETLKKEYAEFIEQQPLKLSSEERKAIQDLSTDIPKLWHSSTTSPEDKKGIVRQLIDRIIVTVQENTEKVDVRIHWAGGCETKTSLIRPVAKLEQLSYYPKLLEKVIHLKTNGKTTKEIAQLLNEEGWRPAKRRETFNASMVVSLLARTNVKRVKHLTPLNKKLHEWSLTELARKLKTPQPTLFSWLKKGKLTARRAKTTSGSEMWLIWADKREIKRLEKLKIVPKQWIGLVQVNKLNEQN